MLQTTFTETDKKQLLNLNIFGLGLVIYYVGYLLSMLIEGSSLYTFVQLAGLIVMLFKISDLLFFKFENAYLKVVFIIYFFWLMLTILRAGSSITNYYFIRSFFLDAQYGGIPYFVPLILLFRKNIRFYKKLFDLIFIFAVLYILFDIRFLSQLLNDERSNTQSQGVVEMLSELSFPIGFTLFTFYYHSRKKQLLAVLTILLAILFAIIRARRGLIFMYSTVFLFSYLFFIFNSKRKMWPIYLTGLVTILAIFYISTAYKIEKNPILGYALERGTENTREAVELYFYDDMKTNDWIIGRGYNGEYFCPSVDENQVTNYRPYIETGYLQSILKGGLVSVVLFLLIAIPALFKGIFLSKNILSKAAGVWILMALINLYPAAVTKFSLQYLLVWISIGICYSEKIRNMPEKELKELFKNQLKIN